MGALEPPPPRRWWNSPIVGEINVMLPRRRSRVDGVWSQNRQRTAETHEGQSPRSHMRDCGARIEWPRIP
jgi:hypothetical protein